MLCSGVQINTVMVLFLMLLRLVAHHRSLQKNIDKQQQEWFCTAASKCGGLLSLSCFTWFTWNQTLLYGIVKAKGILMNHDKVVWRLLVQSHQ